MVSKELLRKCKEDFDLHLPTYIKMKQYYDNQTDAKANYKLITSRSNLFTDTNFIQKFIQEEANFCCLNKITYTSYNNDSAIIDVIRHSLKGWSEGYNKSLLKTALIFQSVVELYYIDEQANFKALTCSPLDSYVLQDDYGNVQLFIRFFYKKFDDSHTFYADVYSDDGSITHYTVMGTDFMKIPNSNIDTNIFGRIPIGIVKIGELSESLYCRLKGLQDSYTTNLSDQTNINSDLRTKYLIFKNCDPTEEQLNDMKKKATISTGADGDVKWLQSEEVSFKDTLNALSDQIYQQANHINYNVPLQSNTSSLAIEGTLLGLEQKVGDDISAIIDCIKTRIQFLFEYVQKKTGIAYDWKDINIDITKNIPHDNMQAAQIASQSKGILPVKEMLKLYSFIDNPDRVYSELQEENQANSIGAGLLNNTGGGQ